MAEDQKVRRTSIALSPQIDKAITDLMPILHDRTGDRPNASEVVSQAIRCLAAQNGIKIEG